MTSQGRTRAYRSPARLLLLAGTAFAASAAVAQSGPAPAAPPAGSAPAASADAPAQGIQDIVVTAQKRSEKLQNVPVAVSAFDGGQLTRLGIQGSKQLTQVTPGLNFTQSVFSPQPTIRGIGTRGVGPGDESVVPIYVDGVYQSFLAAADMQFNDIERIEVLKGPQGALFGRNATGGAINIITREPTADPHGAISLSYGNYDDIVAKGYASAGIDGLAGDVAFVTHSNKGYIRDFVNGDRYGKMDDVSLRSKIVAKPTDRLKITLAGGYVSNEDSTGEAYRVLNGNSIGRRVAGNPYGDAPYTSALSFDPYNNLRQYSGSVTAVLDLDVATITSITGYQDNKLGIAADSDGSVANLAYLVYSQYSRNLYHETYAASNWGGPFSVIAGFVYYHDHSGETAFDTESRSVSTTGAIGALTVVHEYPNLKTDSYAGYIQGTYKLTDTLSITAGGRYTSEHRTFQSHVTINTTVIDLANAKTFSKFTPSATIQFQPNQHLNIYAKYGEAFKSGLFNASATSAIASQPVQPEKVTQYEVGVKADPLPWLRINLAGYYTNYKDLQSNARDPVTLASFLQNAGGAHIYGGEAELVVKPVDRLNIRAGLSALHGTYRNFPNSTATIPQTTADPASAAACVYGTGTPIGGNRSVVCDVSGKNIIRTPFLTANLGADFSVPVGNGEIGFVGNAYYSGHSYWDTLNRLREPSYVLVNGELSWRPNAQKFRIAVWADNLLNKTYSLTVVSSATADTQVLAPPRTYGVRMSYDF